MQPLRPVLPLTEHELVHDPRLAPGTRHLQCRDPSSVLQVFRGPSADQLCKARYLALSACNVEDTSTPQGLELRVSGMKVLVDSWGLHSLTYNLACECVYV